MARALPPPRAPAALAGPRAGAGERLDLGKRIALVDPRSVGDAGRCGVVKGALVSFGPSQC